MRSIKPILILLLAIGMIAASVPLPAAHALTATAPASGPQVGNQTTSQSGTTGTPPVGGTAQGDPGGAGDGLGADLGNKSSGSLDMPAPAPTVDLLLWLLRLVQAAG